MHVAYSSLTDHQTTGLLKSIESENSGQELSIRYNAYLQACEQFKEEIAAVQKYFPGWIPGFSRP